MKVISESGEEKWSLGLPPTPSHSLTRPIHLETLDLTSFSPSLVYLNSMKRQQCLLRTLDLVPLLQKLQAT